MLMDFGLRSMSYNGTPQLQRRRHPGDEPTFGKQILRKSAEEEMAEEEQKRKGEGFRHSLASHKPSFHIIA